MLVKTTNPGKSLVFATQAVVHPRPHRRSTTNRGAGVHKRVGRVVINLLGDQRTDNANIVRNFRRAKAKSRLSTDHFAP